MYVQNGMRKPKSLHILQIQNFYSKYKHQTFV